MKIIKKDFLSLVAILLGTGIFITALLTFKGVIDRKAANSIMILLAGILQISIGIIFSIKNKKIESRIFYGLSVIIIVIFILNIIK